MIERIIENWLTKSSERSYQLPFCYLLMQEGKTVIHLTRHCSMEQGKDIIALDNTGMAHAYQLKGVNGGRLKMSGWQEIQNQILQLIHTPCSHPSIKFNEYHKSYLVINGDIDEDVQHAITIKNNDWEKRGFPQYKLEVIVKGEILAMAFKVREHFIPSEVYDFKSLLEFYLQDGIGFLDKEKFASLLLGITEKENLKSENEFKRLTTSTALLCSLATTSYSNQNNHFAIIEAWTIYISTILRFIEKHKKKLKSYEQEIELAQKIIITSLLNLFEEVRDKSDFLKGNVLTDAFIFKHRTTIILGMLAYLGTVNDEIPFSNLDSVIQKHFKDTIVWGEAAIPFFVSVYLFYKKYNQQSLALQVISSVVIRSIEAIASPDILFSDIYTSAEDSIIQQFHVDEKKGSQSPRISYILEPLLILISQPELRSLVQQIWPEVTRCIFTELKFESQIDYYLWRIENGVEIARNPELTKSWKDLLSEAKSFDISQIPEGFLYNPSFLHLFWMVYPHRLNSNILKWYIIKNI